MPHDDLDNGGYAADDEDQDNQVRRNFKKDREIETAGQQPGY